MKTYNVFHKDEMIGYVESDGTLVYAEDGNSTIGQIVGKMDDWKLATSGLKHHRNDLDGQQVTIALSPSER